MHAFGKAPLAALLALTAAYEETRWHMSTYISDRQSISRQHSDAAVEREMREAIARDDRGHANSARLYSRPPAVVGADFDDGDNLTRFDTPARWRQGGLMDVTVKIDLRAGLPIYRLILAPDDFDAAAAAGWRETAEAALRGGPLLTTLFAKLPKDRRLIGGRLTIDRTYCAECLFGKIEGTPSKAGLEKALDANRQLSRATDGQTYIFERFRLTAKAPDLQTGPEAFAATRRGGQTRRHAGPRRPRRP
ncbi:MAG: hypothetical protein ACJA1L_002266 [Paracoccaceae bacterium]|jgi:hypothetical protein